MKCRYVYTPAAGKIRRHRRSLRDLLRGKAKRKQRIPDVFPIVDYYPPIYPTNK